MEMNLKVSSDELNVKVEEIRDIITNLDKKIFATMDLEVSNSEGYWTGTAGKKYRSEYEEVREDATKIFSIINAYADTLSKISGNYSKVESEIETEIINSLPQDIFS